MANFADTIARCGGECFTVTRRKPEDGADVFVDGFYQPPEPEVFQGDGSVQQANPDEIQMLPEGTRTDEMLKIYTTCELFGARRGARGVADVVTVRGADYEVHEVSNWRRAGNFYKYMLTRVGQ